MYLKASYQLGQPLGFGSLHVACTRSCSHMGTKDKEEKDVGLRISVSLC